MGPALVLDHGGLPAEAARAVSRCQWHDGERPGQILPLEAPIVGAFVWSLPGVDATMSRETRRLLKSVGHRRVAEVEDQRTSENRLLQPRCWHM